jgi:hypothetical protein
LTTERTYGKILIGITLLVLLFHLLIVVKVIPYQITWGGKLKTDSEMYVFEAASILINLFFVYLILHRISYVPPRLGQRTVTIILWIFFGLFVLNTLGNLFAATHLERWFTLLTLANAFLIWKINWKSVNG